MSEERDELIREAIKNEGLRRAGTHVYHPHFGVIPIDKARRMIDGGQLDKAKQELRPESFYGDPESGAVKWNSATESAPDQGAAQIG